MSRDTSYTQQIPVDVMANRMCNADNRVKLVAELLEEKRALAAEVEELERKVNIAQQSVHRKEKFIEKLLYQIGLMYVNMPTQSDKCLPQKQ